MTLTSTLNSSWKSWPQHSKVELAQRLQELNEGALGFAPPTNDAELKQVVRDIAGIEIPDKQVCDDHVSPFRAFADAYFARSSVAVWKASRGFGGKSVLLATLAYTEAICLKASVNLMGGSGEQAQRVHSYIKGDDTNLPKTFWENEGAPVKLLYSDPTARETKLVNGGRLTVLMASQKSVRGPHPQRLRIDEVDECEQDIYEAAMGQPMEARGIMEQTVLSSTHQYAAGTMTEVLKQAGRKGWPIYEWCWRESAESWLSGDQVERKKGDVTSAMWDVEYELQEPNPGARAIHPDKVNAMFNRDLGDVPGELGVYYEFEKPVENGTYAHGADWARKVDNTVIVTFRTDVSPIRLVAFERTHKQPWPIMVGLLEERVNNYGGEAVHDGTGLGDVVDGYLKIDAEGFLFIGRQRSELLNNYITAIEGGEIVSPHIDYMHSEHLYASVDDVYGSGHLPDTISAGATGYRASEKDIDWEQTEGLGHVDDYEEESLWR